MDTRMMTCVNRNCCKPMDSLSVGRLFHFEILSISVAADDCNKEDWDEVPHRETVQFWLCGSCSSSMTLQLKPIGGVHLLPRQTVPDSEMFERSGRLAEFHQNR